MASKGPNTSSRRAEALDLFESSLHNRLTITTANHAKTRGMISFDDHREEDPDGSLFQAHEEERLRTVQIDGMAAIVRELDGIREQLLSAGCDIVDEGTLVTLKKAVAENEDENEDDPEQDQTYLIVPNGAASNIVLRDSTRVTCLSPESEKAQHLIGSRIGDEIKNKRGQVMEVASIE